MTALRLTKLAQRGGCAAKQPPGVLLPLLARLPSSKDPRLLVGSATSDDASVYKLTDEIALVMTTDFFTPVVDDPYTFGAIAAANALSDVYAMGGTPLSALNLVGFSEATLPLDALGEILRGGAETCAEAGIEISGGHTIHSEEPLYGLAVTGTVHPDKVVTNAGGRPGDVLILTKPLGFGIITTAAKRDEDSLGAIEEAIRWMTTLNRDSASAMIAHAATAATDVTGFGLLGHLRNLVVASDVSARVSLRRVPVLDAAWTYVEKDIVPGGTRANWRFLNSHVTYESNVGSGAQLLLCDAQTSGGLLIACPRSSASALLRELNKTNQAAVDIGELGEGPPVIAVTG